MVQQIVKFSIRNKLLVILGVVALILAGLTSMRSIPLDAVPDITNNQVQVVTVSPTLAPQEVEQLITYPLEAAMTNIPGVVEVRSISRYALSVITVVFEDHVETMLARQYVQEQLNVASAEIPDGLARPELMPITTGLGEIYQYVLTVEPEYGHMYDATELRTIQDWIVKRQLNGTKGIIEVSSFGGYLKQYEVACDPYALQTYNVTIQDVIQAIESNNQNSGGSYIENGPYAFYIRSSGRIEDIEELTSIPVINREGTIVRISDVATVRTGSAKRYGAMTMDGQGEVVGGITLMLKGANSSEALGHVRSRIEDIKPSLPPGVGIYPYLDRSRLISKTTHTVRNNLLEGGAIVIIILLLLLGNLRAGLIVASVIPLSMLFAFIMMRFFGISANLMSLGAIDFGIVVDGAVIIVESLLHVLAAGYVGRQLSRQQMDTVVIESTTRIYRAAAFGVLIILIVFVPILTLKGIEGKTFMPMAQTVGFAILGSLILSLTYVPVISALVMSRHVRAEQGLSHRLMRFLQKVYEPILALALRFRVAILTGAVALFVVSVYVFNGLGAEFVPTLEEGDLAMQQTIKAGSSLDESINSSTRAEAILMQFPEVKHVVSKIGTAEVPTDPMAIEDADIMIVLEDKDKWVTADTREGLIEHMKQALAPITWASYEFTQPIQLRFNELMTGAKTDIAVKIFGENVDSLKAIADRAAMVIESIPGAADVKVDQTDGLQQLKIEFDRARMARYGVNIVDANQVVRAAYAGEPAGQVFEEERKFDIAVRLAPEFISELDLSRLYVRSMSGSTVPLSAIADVTPVEGPSLISREMARRFINIGVNVRGRDVESLVYDIKDRLEQALVLPPGYSINFGGQFENLQAARQRLMVAVPIALLLILLLLYMAFSSIKDALIIFTTVPLSAIGGIMALYLRDMPFSISSGIGFIALFGVSVLNGIVLLSAIKQLDMKEFPSMEQLIHDACISRLRPVLMTALVAAFGFLPMALSTSNGAEVQRPLATVVIGGLVSSTILTLVVLPSLYYLISKWRPARSAVGIVALFILLSIPGTGSSQRISSFDDLATHALRANPEVQNLSLNVEKIMRQADAIGQWSPLNADYIGGNINSGAFDHYIELDQSFGHLLTNKVRREHAQASVGVATIEQQVQVNIFLRRLHQLYTDLTYWNEVTRVWRDIEQSYLDIMPVLEVQNEVGAIDAVTFSLARSELLAIQHQARITGNNVSVHEMAIGTLAALDSSASLSVGALQQVTLLPDRIDSTVARYRALFESRQDEILARSQMELAIARTPDMHLGLMTQSFDNEFGYYGVLAGVSVPIDRRTARSRADQFRIDQQIVANSSRQFELQYGNTVLALERALQVHATSLEQYDVDFLQQNAQTTQLLDLQLQEGTIDFVNYQQIRRRYLTLEIEYLDIIRQYNRTAIDLMYFIPQF